MSGFEGSPEQRILEVDADTAFAKTPGLRESLIAQFNRVDGAPGPLEFPDIVRAMAGSRAVREAARNLIWTQCYDYDPERAAGLDRELAWAIVDELARSQKA